MMNIKRVLLCTGTIPRLGEHGVSRDDSCVPRPCVGREHTAYGSTTHLISTSATSPLGSSMRPIDPSSIALQKSSSISTLAWSALPQRPRRSSNGTRSACSTAAIRRQHRVIEAGVFNALPVLYAYLDIHFQHLRHPAPSCQFRKRAVLHRDDRD